MRNEFKQEMQRDGDLRDQASLALKEKMENSMKLKLDTLLKSSDNQKEEIEKLT